MLLPLKGGWMDAVCRSLHDAELVPVDTVVHYGHVAPVSTHSDLLEVTIGCY